MLAALLQSRYRYALAGCRKTRSIWLALLLDPDKLTNQINETGFPLDFHKSTEKLLWHGGNSMARTSRTTGEPRAGCSKILSSKATVPQLTVVSDQQHGSCEEARTPLADFFSILLQGPR